MTMAATAGRDVGDKSMTAGERKVIFASSLGTVFEWYDFYLYGWTAAQIGKAFYSAFDANTQFIFALLTFSAGFLVRPFGALVFGRVGDLVGRKYTFLVTITIMGLSTFLVGLTPGYETHRLAGAGDPDRPALPARPRARRRIWRSGDLCRRARPAGPPRLLHLVDPDHGDHRPVPVAARGLHRAQQHEPGSLRRLRPVRRLAHSVFAVDLPARHFGLDPSAIGGIADVPEDEGRRHAIQGAAVRSFRQLDRTARSRSSRCSA